MKQDNSPKVVQRSKIKDLLEIREFPWTDKQKEFIELTLRKETKVIFIEGPAGTSKSLLSIYCGLKLINDRKLSDFIYVRTIIESASKGLGSLPGLSEEKFKPFQMPLDEKLIELLPNSEIQKLYNDNRVHPIPVNFLRGCSFFAKFVFFDECQNATFPEIVTCLTRYGKFSKMILAGDSRQSDLNGKSGWSKMFELFNDEISKQNGIFCFKFDKSDVMRSEELKFILDKIDSCPK